MALTYLRGLLSATLSVLGDFEEPGMSSNAGVLKLSGRKRDLTRAPIEHQRAGQLVHCAACGCPPSGTHVYIPGTVPPVA